MNLQVEVFALSGLAGRRLDSLLRTHMCVCIYACTHVRMYLCLYVCMYVCMYKYACILLYAYVHTYMCFYRINMY